MTLKRTILLVLLLCLFLALFAGTAQAVKFFGGTPEQQATVTAIVASSAFDFGYVERKLGREISVQFREGGGGSAMKGSVCIGLGGDPLYIIPHEFSHEIWFAMSATWRLKWTWFCTWQIATYDERQWVQDPAENFAECMRVALFPGSVPAPQTYLRVIPPDRCLAFLDRWHFATQWVAP